MRRNTAVRNLSKVATTVQQDWVAIPQWLPITALWAYGELLEAGVDSVEVARVALVIDLPAEEVTWLAPPASLAGFASAARLENLPVTITWRPAAWPVWNHAIRRPVRIWSLSGPDEAALRALANGTGIDEHRSADPDPEIYREQLFTELAASLTHLQRVTDNYWESDWRADHKGCGVYTPRTTCGAPPKVTSNSGMRLPPSTVQCCRRVLRRPMSLRLPATWLRLPPRRARRARRR